MLRTIKCDKCQVSEYTCFHLENSCFTKRNNFRSCGNFPETEGLAISACKQWQGILSGL